MLNNKHSLVTMYFSPKWRLVINLNVNTNDNINNNNNHNNNFHVQCQVTF